MPGKLILGLIAALSLWSCEDTGPTPDVSACINSKIQMFPPDCGDSTETSVDEYLFQEDLVYVFEYRSCCCDYSSPVLNAACDTQGELGGFIGNSIINGEDFSHAVFQRKVWP